MILDSNRRKIKNPEYNVLVCNKAHYSPLRMLFKQKLFVRSIPIVFISDALASLIEFIPAHPAD